jgi:hypothetical protein
MRPGRPNRVWRGIFGGHFCRSSIKPFFSCDGAESLDCPSRLRSSIIPVRDESQLPRTSQSARVREDDAPLASAAFSLQRHNKSPACVVSPARERQSEQVLASFLFLIVASLSSISTARGTESVNRACDAIDPATKSVQLPIGFPSLAGGQPLTKNPYLFVLVALIEATSRDRLIPQFLQKGWNGFNPDAPPVGGQRAPSRHGQAIAGGSFGQNFNETSC